MATPKSDSRRTVLVVDDHPIVRRGVCSVLDRQDRFIVVGEARDCATAEREAARLTPAFVLMDLRLPDGDGVAATRAVLKAAPRARVLILTSYDGDETIHRALEAGARGFLFKDLAAEGLVDALTALDAGRHYMPPEAAARLLSKGPRVVLTKREREVLAEMAEGSPNKVIAHRLGVSDATVRTHVENVLAKFECRQRGAAVAAAIARGFLL